MKKRYIYIVLIIAFAIKVKTLSQTYGFYQGDPFEYVYMANKLVEGFSSPPPGFRSWFYPFFLAPPIIILKLFNIDDAGVLIKSMELVPVIFSLGSIYLTFLIGRRVKNEFVGLVAALLLSFNVLYNFWSVSTTSEIPSVFFVLLSYHLYLKPRHKKTFIYAGVFAGFAAMIRYQSVVFLLPVIIIELSKKNFKNIYLFFTGFFLAMLLQGILDLWIYNTFLHSLQGSFHRWFISDEPKWAHTTHMPLFWYLSTMPQWLSLLEVSMIMIALMVIYKERKSFIIFLAATLMLVVMSYIGYTVPSESELRFMLPVIPFLCILAALGVSALKNVMDSILKKKFFSSTLLLILFVHLTFAKAHMIDTIDYSPQGGFVDAIKYLIENEDEATVATMSWAVGGKLYVKGTGIRIISAEPLRWGDREWIESNLNRSDYFLMWDITVKRNEFVSNIVDADFQIRKKFKRNIILFEKKNAG